MRAPLLLFPLVLSGLADAMVSFGRLTKFLTAEELAETYLVDKSQVPALYLDGDFEWETVLKLEDTPEQPLSQAQEIENLRKEAARKKAEKTRLKEAKKTKITKLDEKADNGHDILPSHTGDFRADIQESPGDKPFALKNIHVEIQEGAFVAIVGPVGSGKASISLPFHYNVTHLTHLLEFNPASYDWGDAMLTRKGKQLALFHLITCLIKTRLFLMIIWHTFRNPRGSKTKLWRKISCSDKSMMIKGD